MSLLITVETRDLILVFLPLSLLVSNLGNVDSGVQDGEIPEILPIYMLLLFLVFHEFIERLGILVESGHGSPRSLKIITTIHRFLGLDFMSGGMSRSIFLEIIQVSLSYVRTRL